MAERESRELPWCSDAVKREDVPDEICYGECRLSTTSHDTQEIPGRPGCYDVLCINRKVIKLILEERNMANKDKKKTAGPGPEKEKTQAELEKEADAIIAGDKAMTILADVGFRCKSYLRLFNDTQEEIRKSRPAMEEKAIRERLVPLRVVIEEIRDSIIKMGEKLLDRFPSLTSDENATPSMFDKDGKRIVPGEEGGKDQHPAGDGKTSKSGKDGKPETDKK